MTPMQNVSGIVASPSPRRGNLKLALSVCAVLAAVNALAQHKSAQDSDHCQGGAVARQDVKRCAQRIQAKTIAAAKEYQKRCSVDPQFSFWWSHEIISQLNDDDSAYQQARRAELSADAETAENYYSRAFYMYLSTNERISLRRWDCERRRQGSKR